MLPREHELSGLDAAEIGPGEIVPLEAQLLAALQQEAEEPSGDNVPSEGQPLRSVTTADSANGQRKTVFYGESFIKGLSRPGRKVLRLINPQTGEILFGAPFSRMG
jgi:hypothetical protein